MIYKAKYEDGTVSFITEFDDNIDILEKAKEIGATEGRGIVTGLTNVTNSIWFKGEYESGSFNMFIPVSSTIYDNPYVVTTALQEATHANNILELGALVKLSVVDNDYDEIKVILDLTNNDK